MDDEQTQTVFVVPEFAGETFLRLKVRSSVIVAGPLFTGDVGTVPESVGTVIPVPTGRT